MDDLISRQAAIDALQKEINKGIPPFDDVMGSIRCGVRLARNIIEDLPSAQPERKKGHWQIYIISMLDGEGCKCSECGHEGVPYWDFCPNCGALMDGEVEVRK